MPTERDRRFKPVVPRMWDDVAMSELELPLPREKFSLRQIQADYYYRIPARQVFKTYPVYARGREPKDYLPTSLRRTRSLFSTQPR